MIYDHFRANGAFDAAQGLSDLINIYLHDDDIQDFNVTMGASSTVCKRSTQGKCPGEFLRIRESVQLQTVFAMYEQVID